MGDRGNIVFNQADGGNLWMYGHWAGHDMPCILKRALVKGRSRWDDESYLARVVFQELIGKDNDVTGFGLSTYPGDNEYPVLVVDVATKTVRVSPFSDMGKSSAGVSFSEYCALSDDEARAFRENASRGES